MLIGIAVHGTDTVPFKAYANHIAAFNAWAKKFNTIFLGVYGDKVASSRNTLVKEALNNNCTHIIFVDTDHMIPHHMLESLLNTGADVASGLACKRGMPFNQVGYTSKDGQNYTVKLPLDGRVYSVDVCAFGCTLIDMKVFSYIEEPFFKDMCIRGEDGKLYNKRSDVHFCNEVKENSGSIVIDTNVMVGHMLDGLVVYPDTADEMSLPYQRLLDLSVDEAERKVLI